MVHVTGASQVSNNVTIKGENRGCQQTNALNTILVHILLRGSITISFMYIFQTIKVLVY